MNEFACILIERGIMVIQPATGTNHFLVFNHGPEEWAELLDEGNGSVRRKELGMGGS